VTTLVARRAQMHQANLATHTTPYDVPFQAKLDGIARSLEQTGSTSLVAAKQATSAMYRQLVQQSTQLAYLDALWLLALASAMMVPLVWFAQRPRGGSPAGH
jgi:DHA2 family multidrug resistance protein